VALDALRVALQGLYQLTPIALAVQGLIEELLAQPAPKPPESGGGGAVRHAQQERRRKRLAELERQRVKRNNDLILAVAMASLTQGLIQ
jgi:hypothetical protein